MKKAPRQRWLSLLLTLAMCLTLAPAVWAAESSITITDPEESTLYMKKGEKKILKAEAIGPYAWESSDKAIVSVNSSTSTITANKPGTANIYAFLRENTSERATLKVTVSGVIVPDSYSIPANSTKDLMPVVMGWCVGDADPYNLVLSSLDTDILEIDDGIVTGVRPGEAKVEIRYGYISSGGTDTETLTVVVEKDPATVINAGTLATNDPLPFKGLSFPQSLGGSTVAYVTGLYVPTDAGTLYYGYRSEAEPGAGVGQSQSYYLRPDPGQRKLDDVTFVPKSSYPGGKVTITFSAVTTDGQQHSCTINLTLKGVSDGDSTAGNISLKTSYGAAVHFDSIEFGSVCREKLGSQLDHVVFSQPPERQGALYTNYSSSSNYGSLVDIHRQYSRRELDDVWFVPAPGYSGIVTVYYTGFGTNGKSYTGQVFITVEQEDSVATGGLSYSVSPGGAVRFDDADFNRYCQTILDQSQSISGIRFESLPSESDGVLYYDYQSLVNPGARALAGTVYYPGTRAPRIDRLAFVASESFTGTLRLPFTGWTTDGTSFSGTLEINVRGGVASGDIYYYCAAGRSVSFSSSDFTSMSRSRTNRTLSYIYFQNLPDSAEGYLSISSSRVSTGTHYSTSDISRMTFRASNRFSGLVNMSFVGVSTGGDTFTGVVTIGSGSTTSSSGNSSGTNSGSSSGTNSTIRYITDSTTAAVFDRDDFDNLSQWQADRNVSSIRFILPPSSQGSLYRNYRSSASMGTRITSSTSITRSDLDQVAFVPASGYTGTVYIDFTGTASNGDAIDGTVEVDVGLPAANVMAQYSTRTAPVHFYAVDLAQSGSSLSSIRFTSLPSSGAGYLYYQYTSPTQYGQQVNTGTTYHASDVSYLAFVPRAGYSGTVTIPYTGTNSNNTTFSGEVIITVSPTYNSYYFNDMAGYGSAQIAAVDFLYDHNITHGLTTDQYGPESFLRRGDFALMLYQAFAFFPISGGSFTDVSPDAYYATAVNTLYARGVVSGTGGGYYAPDSTLTRQDAICMVQRAMQAIGWSASDGYTSALAGYGDSASVSGYAQGAMALAVQRGYLPTTGGWLNPQQPLTRVDMAELLHRALTY